MGQELQCTWKKDGNTITLTNDAGADMKIDFKGSELKMEYQGTVAYFKEK